MYRFAKIDKLNLILYWLKGTLPSYKTDEEKSSCLNYEKQLGKLESQPCDDGEFVEFKQSARTALETKFKMISAEHSRNNGKNEVTKKA